MIDVIETKVSEFLQSQLQRILEAEGLPVDFRVVGVEERAYLFDSASSGLRLRLFVDDDDFLVTKGVFESISSLPRKKQNKIPCETFVRAGKRIFGFIVTEKDNSVSLDRLGADAARHWIWQIGACIGMLHEYTPVSDSLGHLNMGRLSGPLLALAGDGVERAAKLPQNSGFCHGNITLKTIHAKALPTGSGHVADGANMPLFKFSDFSFAFLGNRTLDAAAALISLGALSRIGGFYEGYMFGLGKDATQKGADSFSLFVLAAAPLVFVREYLKTVESTLNLTDVFYNKANTLAALATMEELDHPMVDTARRAAEKLS